jgi:5-methylcytosine-specific restriction endonuclease McrA
MRDMIWDQPKSIGQMKKELGKCCSIPGCGKPLTHMQGPGSGVLCRDHQLKQREYGGMGRIDRPHTFHRKCICDHCGKDVAEEVRKKYPNIEEADPIVFNRLCRNRIIGDHIVRRADGGDDSEENLQSLCLDCDSDKTILNEDFRKAD